MKPIRWRRVLFAYVAGTLILCGLLLAVQAYFLQPKATASADSGSQLVVEATRHDFGRVTGGVVLRHEFTMRNRGTTRIVLNQDGCGGCGDDTIDGYVIVPPGGQLQLPLTLETAGQSGSLRRVVTITTSDPHRPRIEFTLTAQIVKTDDRTGQRSTS